MSEFAVYTDSLRGCASQLTGVESQLEDIRSRLSGIQLGCILQIRASSTMINRLRSCANAVGNESIDLGKLSDTLNTIARLYDTYEGRLAEPSTGTAGNNTSGNGTVDENASNWWGAGVRYSIDTKLGPLSLDVSSSNISRKVNLYFSFGHYF